MRAANILAIVGTDAEILGAAIAARLHIPHIRTSDAGAVTTPADECRAITECCTANATKFTVLTASAETLAYPPSLVVLSAKTTLCALSETPVMFADMTLSQSASVEDVVSRWLSAEILATFHA